MRHRRLLTICVTIAIVIMASCNADTPVSDSDIVDAVPNPTPVSPTPEPEPVSPAPGEIPVESTPQTTKVAFVGDQGAGADARAVLALVRSEGADILLLQGDLGYVPDTAAQWDSNITDVLGPDFPVLTVVGNHENFEWPLYQQLIQNRIDRASGVTCEGETGVKANCAFRNIHVTQVAVGIFEVPGIKSKDQYADYIRSSFDRTPASWRICSWHKNQTAMQVYRKGNATGWDVFNACLDAGAMIAMGHAHTYSRTFLMNDYENQTIEHRNNVMRLEPGKSFAFVSGLGGRNIKPQERDGDIFASVYTASQGATHGALFCALGQTSGQCYFKAIDGAVPDTFSLELNSGNNNSN